MENLEKSLEHYPSFVTLEKMKLIVNQIENSICTIYGEGKHATGFFSYLNDNFNKKRFPVLITNNHVIDEEYFSIYKKIKISFNNEKKFMDLVLHSKLKKYTNKDYDITIIEIKKDILNNINAFLEIDEKIFQENSDKIFNKTTSYIIHYPNIKQAAVSYGLINRINNDCKFLSHFCETKDGSSGSPIINLESNKVIAVHIGASDKYNYNIGTFLKHPINEYFNLYNEDKNIAYNNKEEKKNEIKITLKIGKTDINKKIYFLDNTSQYLEKNHKTNPHCYLSELNESNTELYINEYKYKYQKYFEPSSEGSYNIQLKFHIYMKDCSYMFYYCKHITSIDFSHFKTNAVTNMNNMFCYCLNLKELDLSCFNTENVITMSNMFSFCNFNKINLSSFNTKNVNDMSNMFIGCQLNKLDISSFIASPNLNKECMFEKSRIKHLKINKEFGNFIIDEDTKIDYV